MRPQPRIRIPRRDGDEQRIAVQPALVVRGLHERLVRAQDAVVRQEGGHHVHKVGPGRPANVCIVSLSIHDGKHATQGAQQGTGAAAEVEGTTPYEPLRLSTRLGWGEGGRLGLCRAQGEGTHQSCTVSTRCEIAPSQVRGA